MRSFTWPNLGADSSAVGLYCVTISQQKILGSLQVTTVVVLPHAGVERIYLGG